MLRSRFLRRRIVTAVVMFVMVIVTTCTVGVVSSGTTQDTAITTHKRGPCENSDKFRWKNKRNRDCINWVARKPNVRCSKVDPITHKKVKFYCPLFCKSKCQPSTSTAAAATCTRTGCGHCLNSSVPHHCAWKMVTNPDGTSANGKGTCLPKQKCRPGVKTTTGKIVTCGTGLSATQRQQVPRKVWQQTNKNRCARTNAKVQRVVTALREEIAKQNEVAQTSCAGRSGNCRECLLGTTTTTTPTRETETTHCAYVPVTQACHTSCSATDVPHDTGCIDGGAGTIPKTEEDVEQTCVALSHEQQNAKVCRRQSTTGCHACTSTIVRRTRITNEGTILSVTGPCHWFLHGAGNEGGYCASECTAYSGCGRSNPSCQQLPVELPPTKPDYDEINKALCQKQSRLGCGACTGIKIKVLNEDGSGGPASTCKWFPAVNGNNNIAGGIPLPDTTTDELLKFQTMDWGRGSHSGIHSQGPENHVFRSAPAFAEFWARHVQDTFPPKDVPEIDFTTNMIIAVMSGEQTTGGYGIEIVSITHHTADADDSDSAITVWTKTTAPGAEEFVLTALTQPFNFVIVKALPTENVRFTTDPIRDAPISDDGYCASQCVKEEDCDNELTTSCPNLPRP